MKKIIILAVLFVFIPFFVAYMNINYWDLEIIDLNSVSNMKVRVKRLSSGNIDVIPIEEYVCGVVAGEMPVSFELEALKAQAVASRTYVLKRIYSSSNNDYDVVDSVSNQVYVDNDNLKKKWGVNYGNRINRVRSAVNATSLEYLVYDDEVIDALFFSTSNGYTEDSGIVFNYNLPYLKSVNSEWDRDVSMVFDYSVSISLQEFYDRIGLKYSNDLVISNVVRSNSNRVISISINNYDFKGTDLYKKLSLRSLDFSFERVGNNVIIKTKGYGHGVGMSQYGAQGMAKNGYDYKDILSHYYSGTVIKKIDN